MPAWEELWLRSYQNILQRSYSALEILMDLFKIRQSILLIFTGIMGYLIASGARADPLVLGFLVLSLSLTIFGTTGVNMALDSDIDGVMSRTRRRAIPRGAISRRRALAVSQVLLVAGLWVAIMINFWVFIAGLLGFLIDILIYTILTKRRTWTSVIYGGFAGGMPAFGGYMAYIGHPNPESLVLLLIVALWSNAHIWYIVIYNREDYEKAGIPMLPIVKGVRAGVMGSIMHTILMLALVAIYFILTGYRAWITLIVGSALSIRLLTIMWSHLKGVSKRDAYKIFKVLSPYLAIIFILMLIDRILGI